MTAKERLAKAHEAQVAVYLRMTESETQRQQIQGQISFMHAEILRLDGEVRSLEAQIAEASDGV